MIRALSDFCHWCFVEQVAVGKNPGGKKGYLLLLKQNHQT